MSQRSILIVGSLFALVLFLAIPLVWQWNYKARLEREVPIGSTWTDYKKAIDEGRLGQGMPRLGLTFWRPFEFHGFIYTIVAYPKWDSHQHLSQYGLFPKVSVRGHAFWLLGTTPTVQPPL